MKNIRSVLALLMACAMPLALSSCGTTRAADGDTAGPIEARALAAVPNMPFADLPVTADYIGAVAYCYENGLMNGVSATAFDPEGSLTRAMTAAVFYRVAGEPRVSGQVTFSDAESGAWYSDALLWADSTGLMRGYGEGAFGINDPVSVEQLDVILRRYEGETPAWVGDPARAVSATRAQVAVALYTLSRKTSGETVPASITTNGGEVIALTDLAHYDADAESRVFYFSDISPESLMAIYRALEWSPEGKVAVKLSTGEPPASHYLDPALIKDVVQSVEGTIVECNTAYGGSRASTAMHLQVAKDHGFTDIAEVDIMDADGTAELTVTGGDNLTKNIVGSHFENYDSFLVLSHFKGHAMAGFGGAIKNISIGIASSSGKVLIHSGGHSSTSWGGGTQDQFLESMAEAGKSVVDALDGKIVYISVMNRLSVDCDCDGNAAEPDMHDIGVLASYDPVALDQACVDLVYAVEDGGSLIRRMESRNGVHTLEQGEKIGLGSRSYTLTDIG